MPLAALAASFDALTAHTGLPVRRWDHPQYPDTGATHPPIGRDTAERPEVDPYLGFLAGASLVVSGYSTGALEAIYLGKRVVLLPSYGLTAWSGYPAVARDASLAEVLGALHRLDAFPNATASFLRETFGGLRFDHTERAWAALNEPGLCVVRSRP